LHACVSGDVPMDGTSAARKDDSIIAPAFSTDRIETVCSHKTIYVRFDLNDYSILPEAVGRQLTLLASDTSMRILDGSVEIARHVRSYDSHQPVLDPAHQDAVLKIKRKAFHSTSVGRLEQAAPDSKTLFDLAFAQGESAGNRTAHLMKLLDQYGAAVLRRAIAEALQRNTPRASSVAFLVRRQPRSTLVALDLSRHPQAESLDVRLMIWRLTMNSLATKAITPTIATTSSDLSSQLQHIGLCALPTQLDDFIARATKSRWSTPQILEQLVIAEAAERSRRSLERRLRISGIKTFKLWPTSSALGKSDPVVLG